MSPHVGYVTFTGRVITASDRGQLVEYETADILVRLDPANEGARMRRFRAMCALAGYIP